MLTGKSAGSFLPALYCCLSTRPFLTFLEWAVVVLPAEQPAATSAAAALALVSLPSFGTLQTGAVGGEYTTPTVAWAVLPAASVTAAVMVLGPGARPETVCDQPPSGLTEVDSPLTLS